MEGENCQSGNHEQQAVKENAPCCFDGPMAVLSYFSCDHGIGSPGHCGGQRQKISLWIQLHAGGFLEAD